MKKSQKTKLEKIRKAVEKEKKRLRITEPKFTIQIGAFLNEENAVTLFNSLKMKDYDLHLFTATDTLGRVWYNVRIGFYPDFNKASMAADSISLREDMPTLVRPLDKL